MATERTPLQPTGATPSYMVSSDDEDAYYTPRNRNIKQFQCCICTSLLTAFFAALIIAVCYSITNPDKLPLNENITILIGDTNGTEIVGVDVENATQVLLAFLQFPIEDDPNLPWDGLNITEAEQNKTIQEAEFALAEKEVLEEKMRPPAALSPTYKHQKAVATSLQARLLAKKGFIEDHVTRKFAGGKNHKKTKKRWNIGQGRPIDLGPLQNKTVCDFNAKFRTVDGSCNNKKNPHTFGVAYRPFRRAINPDYADGVSLPRDSIGSQPLPTARQVSLQIHRPSYQTDPQFTVMLAVWGQFLDHDITATALSQGLNGAPIECCNIDVNLPLHPECFPVPIKTDDPFYEQFNVTCMNFVRSSPAPTGKLGPREQLNQATSFIDGSVVYGNTEEKQAQLRTFENGKLQMFTRPDQTTLLPVSRDPNDGCNEDEMNAKGKYCFDSGDTRANENLHLTSMHLIWARHHNYLVENLAKLNPHWNDERLFQEGRKILGAQMQHITYNEFLTVVLGKDVSKKFRIISDPTNSKDLYNDTMDASIANHFAAAAFRFAHTLLPRLFLITRDTTSPEAIAMHKMLFNPYSLYNDNGLDNAMHSAMNTPLERSDPYFNDELKQHLFEKPTQTTWNTSSPCGLDLVSLNIQRGRDHGLPPYPDFRKYCHLPPVDTWEEMSRAVDHDSLQRMKDLYKVPENVDVYTGGLSEPPMQGGILGPLFNCLIGEQFYRIKFGDSFWFERRVGPQRFSTPQLIEIYKTLLSSIICRNSDHVSFTQRYVMKRSGPTNKLEDCTRLDVFNFEPWREKVGEKNYNKIPTFREESRVMVVQNLGNSSKVATLNPFANPDPLLNITFDTKTDLQDSQTSMTIPSSTTEKLVYFVETTEVPTTVNDSTTEINLNVTTL